MRSTIVRIAILIPTLFIVSRAMAFDSGSNGSYGPISVGATGTLNIQLPEDGIIHATNVDLAQGSKLLFTRNSRNTPVYLLATETVTIAASASIQVPGAGATATVGGLGGPGGFSGGGPGFDSTPAGAGGGPGGGIPGACNLSVAGAGAGAYRSSPTLVQSGLSPSVNNGAPYGSISLVPLTGGSGGAGCLTGTTSQGGGGGGGAILIASNASITLNGTILATGGDSGSTTRNPGSGGAVRLVAPTVQGSGTIDVRGGPIGAVGDRDSTSGRIRIDTNDPAQLAATYRPAGIQTIGSAMYSFLPAAPRLDIVAAAGTVIAPDSDAVTVTLPFGAPTSQSVTVRATNFTGLVKIAVAVLPKAGARVVKHAQIDMNGAAQAETTVDVTIPANTVTAIQSWTE